MEERNIELEGTRAQLRVLASKSSKGDYLTELDICDNHVIGEVSTPSMKAMIPLPMDDIQTHSSSTESAHDHAERESGRNSIGDGRRKPSKIPLPGAKASLAPKPPTGRNFVNSRSPSSSKSLSKSTSSLSGRSGPSSSPKSPNNAASSLHRPDSVQSLRKDVSLNSNRNSSSIPVASRMTNSPVPRARRDTLTMRVRQMDSISRMHASPTHSSGSSAGNTPTHHSRTASPMHAPMRDRKSSSASPRRSNSNSGVGSKGIDLSSSSVEPVEKVQTNLRKLWNMLKI